MNQELLTLQSLGYFQTEWSAILFLLVIGALYFFAPMVGYVSNRRGALVAAMYAMIGKLALGIFRQSLISLEILAPARYAPPITPIPAAPGVPMPGGMGATGGSFFTAFEEQLPVFLILAESVAFLSAI